MTPVRRRTALVAAAVAMLVIAGLVSIVAIRDRDDSGSAQRVAERYLEILSDETQDLGELEDLVPTGDSEALERAGALLASARMRISEPTLGEAEELNIADEARTSSAKDDVRFDRLERFEVTYRLGGEQHSATITLGLVSSGTDEGWRVVRPLSGEVDWNSATWEQTVLDLRVGDVEVTDPDRTTYEPDAQFVHPGIYPVGASIDRWYSAAEVDVTVPAGEEVVSVPEFDLEPTPVGKAAITRQVLSAFEPCERGPTYCPVLDLVLPLNRDLPQDWWRGLTNDPTVAVDGVDVTLRNGAFRYLSPTGQQVVAFNGSTWVRIDPVTRRPTVYVPLTITRP